MVFIAFNILNPARDNIALDRMLGETAYAAFIYGAFFVLAILARKYPAWALRPLNYQVRGKKRIGPRIVAPLGFVLFAVVACKSCSSQMDGRQRGTRWAACCTPIQLPGDSSPLE